jgi:glycosyltransferase involved in cell wall biosynthesis
VVRTQANKGVLFFSSDDWESGLKTSKYHMARLLAADGYKVLYVNSIGLRRPTLSSGTARKIWSRLQTIFRGVRRVSDNIYVMTPFIIPFHGYPWINRLNRLLLVLGVRHVQRKLGLKRPEMWMFLPNHADLVGEFDESVSLYYVVDEHTLFEGVDQAAMQALDDRLTRNVSLVVATATSLLEARKAKAQRILYLPHGVDAAHFRQALDEGTVIPSDIASLSRPIIGFFGLIEEWIDLDSVAEAARRHPEWTFVLLGKVAVDIHPYENLRNVLFLGPRPYAMLPNYCKGFDCAILPFRITDMTVHVNPLKMREYLAAGLPTVSSDLPEVRAYASIVHIAKGTDDFVEKVEAALASSTDRRELSRCMDRETWESRYRALRSEINGIADPLPTPAREGAATPLDS